MNKREFVHPDPLELLYDYQDIQNREIVGFVVSCLAYGNVKQILKSSHKVLSILGKNPTDFLKNTTTEEKQNDLDGFKHRFTTGHELAALLNGLSRTLKYYGSLENLLKKHLKISQNSFIKSVEGFVDDICSSSDCLFPHLLPNPRNGSACKRLFLFFKWMIRHDDVDPGGWDIPTSLLVIPVDRHMHKISQNLGATCKKSANLKTAIEITEFFKEISPDDPTKYDFVLTRFGIRNEFDRDAEIEEICNNCL